MGGVWSGMNNINNNDNDNNNLHPPPQSQWGACGLVWMYERNLIAGRWSSLYSINVCPLHPTSHQCHHHHHRYQSVHHYHHQQLFNHSSSKRSLVSVWLTWVDYDRTWKIVNNQICQEKILNSMILQIHNRHCWKTHRNCPQNEVWISCEKNRKEVRRRAVDKD